MTTARKRLLAFAGAYIVFVVGVFLSGGALAAGFLTIPGSVVSFVHLAELPPQGSAIDVFLKSFMGNVLLLVVGAALNVSVLFLIVWGRFGGSDSDSSGDDG
jgi:hypothetical protein